MNRTYRSINLCDKSCYKETANLVIRLLDVKNAFAEVDNELIKRLTRLILKRLGREEWRETPAVVF